MPKFPDSFNFIHGRKEVEFWQKTGEVIGTNKFSETHVTSTGGGGTVGGYVGPYGGHVGGTISAPAVSSHAITKHEFWIRTDEGKELPIKLSGVDIPLLAGQRITMIGASDKAIKKDWMWYTHLINHNAGTQSIINSVSELNKNLRLERFNWIGISILIALPIVSEVIVRLNGPYQPSIIWRVVPFLGWAYMAFVAYTVISKFLAISRLKRKLQTHLDGLVQFSKQNFGARKTFTAADAIRAASEAQAQARAKGATEVTIRIDE